jgi:hypothetical protein
MIDYYAVFTRLTSAVTQDINIPEKIEPLKKTFFTSDNICKICLISLFIFAVIIALIASSQLTDKSKTIFSGIIISIGIIISGWTGIKYSEYEDKKQEYSEKHQQFNDRVAEIEETKSQTRLVKKILGNNVNAKEFYLKGQKLFDFCEFYYSQDDTEFCKNNEVNKYTFNKVFSSMYGNDMKDNVKDVDKALNYIKN